MQDTASISVPRESALMARRIESDSAGLSWLQKSLIQKGNLENHAKSREITRMVFHIWLFSWMLIPGVYIWPNVGSLSLHSYMKKYGFHAKSREITRSPLSTYGQIQPPVGCWLAPTWKWQGWRPQHCGHCTGLDANIFKVTLFLDVIWYKVVCLYIIFKQVWSGCMWVQSRCLIGCIMVWI